MNELTEEQQKDIQGRETQFMERYEALTKELQMDFAQFPAFVPIGPGTFGVMMNAQLKDKKYLSVASPIQP